MSLYHLVAFMIVMNSGLVSASSGFSVRRLTT